MFHFWLTISFLDGRYLSFQSLWYSCHPPFVVAVGMGYYFISTKHKAGVPNKVHFYLLFDLSYATVQSPSWEANWFAVSEEIPHISRNPKVHYRTHKRPPPVSILGQPNPVHEPTSHLLQTRPNIIHPSTPTTSPIHYLLTPGCRVLPEQLTGLQLVKKFPAFHGTRRFITALTSVRHLSVSWASPIQSIYPHPTSWRSILIFPPIYA